MSSHFTMLASTCGFNLPELPSEEQLSGVPNKASSPEDTNHETSLSVSHDTTSSMSSQTTSVPLVSNQSMSPKTPNQPSYASVCKNTKSPEVNNKASSVPSGSNDTTPTQSPQKAMLSSISNKMASINESKHTTSPNTPIHTSSPLVSQNNLSPAVNNNVPSVQSESNNTTPSQTPEKVTLPGTSYPSIWPLPSIHGISYEARNQTVPPMVLNQAILESNQAILPLESQQLSSALVSNQDSLPSKPFQSFVDNQEVSLSESFQSLTCSQVIPPTETNVVSSPSACSQPASPTASRHVNSPSACSQSASHAACNQVNTSSAYSPVASLPVYSHVLLPETPNLINSLTVDNQYISDETSNDDRDNSTDQGIQTMQIELNAINCFTWNRFEDAANWYSYGLEFGPKSLRDVYILNRSMCYVNLRKYQEALNDALEVEETSARYPKAIERIAFVFINMQRYEKAKTILESNEHLMETNRGISDLLERTKALIRQRDHGIYDMRPFHNEMGKVSNHLIANYFGPFEIREVPGKGRGLILKDDVKAGQLLLCEKAFGICFYYNKDYHSRHHLVEIIAKAVEMQPEIARSLYLLWAGSKLGYLDPNENYPPIVDRERIWGIVNHNAKGFIHFSNTFSAGLWIFESFINDSCINGNCSVMQYGNVRQIRAIKDMKAGEELLLSSRNSPMTLTIRPVFENIFGCGCDLCVYESLEPETQVQQRDAVLNAFLERPCSENTIESVKETISTLKDLSLISPFQEYYLATPLTKLGVIYYYTHQYEEAIQVMKRFLVYCKETEIWFPYLELEMAINIFRCYMRLGDYHEARKWKYEMQRRVKLFYGCDDLSVLQITDRDLNQTMYPLLTTLLTFLDDVGKS